MTRVFQIAIPMLALVFALGLNAQDGKTFKYPLPVDGPHLPDGGQPIEGFDKYSKAKTESSPREASSKGETKFSGLDDGVGNAKHKAMIQPDRIKEARNPQSSASKSEKPNDPVAEKAPEDDEGLSVQTMVLLGICMMLGLVIGVFGTLVLANKGKS